MKQFTDEDVARWTAMVGKKVWKNRSTETATQPKPFKSGLKVNTVRDVKLHPITNLPAFAFDEDESLVECFRCSLAPELAMPVFAAMKIGDGFEPTRMLEGIVIRD